MTNLMTMGILQVGTIGQDWARTYSYKTALPMCMFLEAFVLYTDFSRTDLLNMLREDVVLKSFT